VNGQEVGVFCGTLSYTVDAERVILPVLKELLAQSASCSMPKGDTKGDLELSVAAIVRAGSRQQNKVAVNKNFPRCTSVGSLLSSRPIGVISSEGVRARTWKNVLNGSIRVKG
jgi:hypothetical protein